MNSTRHVRSHTCGALTAAQVSETVELCGWIDSRRDHGGVIFLDLRDRHGLTQVVFDPKEEGARGAEAHQRAQALRNEWVIWCRGRVRRRPEGMVNKKLPTGEVEIICTELEIFSSAKALPFPLSDSTDVSESLRLKYRYLDLRRPALQHNLITRHRLLMSVRESLNSQGFIEVETPILYKSTPEGARDFIVPSRLNRGTFYALPQSPQTLKQLLMISGMDRYFQVARCFRDEDLRADRQPEFTQIDVELSFVDEKVLFPLVEAMMTKVWRDVMGVQLKTPFPTMSYANAMLRYGSDKPDVRFGLEIEDITGIFAGSSFRAFDGAKAIRAICIKGEAERFSRKDLDDLTLVAGRHGAKGLLWIKVQAGGVLQSPAVKFFSESEIAQLRTQFKLSEGDLVLIVASPKISVAAHSLGAVRLDLGARLGLIPEPGTGDPAFLWVDQFPLLEFNDEDQRWYACHHPFTAPLPEDREKFLSNQDLGSVRASAYDLVLNGAEVGGGSIRIHSRDVQDAMFKTLGLSPEQAREKFGFFLEALEYGTPPHGGIAFGVDRLVGILCGTTAIRDVMAFPKTQKGTCLMSESPSAVEPSQLKELGIALKNYD